MSRLCWGVALASTLVGGVALAESQAEIAERLNEDGKTLMFEEKYAEASAKFQDAHSRVPEPKYFFNHCTSLAYENKFSEALVACNAADKNADDKLKPKIAKLEQRIHDEAQKRGIALEPTGGGGGPGDTPADPNNPGGPQTGPTGPTGPTGTTPPPNPQQQALAGQPSAFGAYAARPENTYTWSLGVDLYGGPGRIGRAGDYGKSTAGFRVKADYLLNPAQRLGAQAYFQLTHYGDGNATMPSGAWSLDDFDLGVAAYKHVCGAHARLCLTPLVGVQLALLSPANQTDTSTGQQVFNYAAVGARLELGLAYALGSSYQHVLGAQLGVNAYTKVVSAPSDGVSAMDWGLDRGGVAGYFGLGYTYRFNTPFGSTPFVTLE